MKRARLVLLFVMLAACGKSAEKCRTEATQLSDLLVAAAQESANAIYVRNAIHLVVRADLPATEVHEAPVVMLTRDGIEYQGETVDIPKLEQRLRNAVAKIREDLELGRLTPRMYPEPGLVHLVIDQAITWEHVVEIQAAANRAGLTAPAFVFEHAQSIKLPPRSAIDDKLDAIEKSEGNQATAFANVISPLIKSCPALIKAFGEVSVNETENKALYLARAVKPALIDCKCDVDVPSLRSAMFRVTYVRRPLREVQLDPNAPPERIEFPKTATWAEASKRFTPTLKNAELVAAD